MAKITAKFVHGCAEVLRELEVEQPDDPPMTYSLCPPPTAVADPEPAWEAVYVRERNAEPEPPWVYRFCGLADPEE
jgi:hypothetical protein